MPSVSIDISIPNIIKHLLHVCTQYLEEIIVQVQVTINFYLNIPFCPAQLSSDTDINTTVRGSNIVWECGISLKLSTTFEFETDY